MHCNEALKGIVLDARPEGVQAVFSHLKGNDRVASGSCSEGEHSYACPNV